jgi:hypothetical protein
MNFDASQKGRQAQVDHTDCRFKASSSSMYITKSRVSFNRPQPSWPIDTLGVLLVPCNFITGQNEREETTQNTTVTKSAACASYKSNYVKYITATYTRARFSLSGLFRGKPLP